MRQLERSKRQTVARRPSLSGSSSPRACVFRACMTAAEWRPPSHRLRSNMPSSCVLLFRRGLVTKFFFQNVIVPPWNRPLLPPRVGQVSVGGSPLGCMFLTPKAREKVHLLPDGQWVGSSFALPPVKEAKTVPQAKSWVSPPFPPVAKKGPGSSLRAYSYAQGAATRKAANQQRRKKSHTHTKREGGREQGGREAGRENSGGPCPLHEAPLRTRPRTKRLQSVCMFI